MGASNALQLELQERDTFKEIREENANYLNRIVYIRDVDNKKITSKNNRYGNQKIKTK